MRIEVSEAMCQGSCVGVELLADHWRNGLNGAWTLSRDLIVNVA